MSNGISKQVTENGFELERKFLTKTNRLEIDRELCIGCGICAIVCPKEAVTLSEPTLQDGRLIEKPEVDIDPGKCVLCGTCVVTCPSNALKATTDGEEYIPVVMYGVIPTLTKNIEVDSEKCEITCELVCHDSCPLDAIQVETSTVEKEKKITNVDVDLRTCIYCKQCEVACPFNLIRVENPFEGVTEIEVEKCPEGCMVCVDICPSEALKPDKSGKPEIDQRVCILCSACERVCPEEAIKVTRTSVTYPEIKSGAWTDTLEKLTSTEILSREMANRAEKRRRNVVKEAYFNLLPAKAE